MSLAMLEPCTGGGNCIINNIFFFIPGLIFLRTLFFTHLTAPPVTRGVLNGTRNTLTAIRHINRILSGSSIPKVTRAALYIRHKSRKFFEFPSITGHSCLTAPTFFLHGL